MWWRTIPVLAITLVLGACAAAPSGPTVMVLPARDKPLDQFNADDVACRQWASRQVTAGSDAEWLMQRRYDIAYQQCMYSHGNDLPGFSRASGAPPPPLIVPGQRVPAPPPGAVTPPPNAPPPPPSPSR
jgi:hypothetical protein